MQNNFDNINNNGTQPFIDFETAWAGLKPELDAEAKRREKRKRRFIIFWFLIAAIGLGGGFYMVNGERELRIGNKDLVVASSEKKAANYKQSKTQHKTLNATESNNEDDKNNATVEMNDDDTKENNGITKKSSNLTKEQSDVAKKHNNVTNVSNDVTKEHSSITKERSNITKERSNITKEHSSITKEHSNIIKKRSNIIKEHASVVTANTSNAKVNTKNIVSNAKVMASNTMVIEPNNSLTKNEVITTQQSNNQHQTPNTKQEEKTKQVENEKQETKKEVTNKKQEIKNQQSAMGYSYGLQWNIPVLDGVNYFDINTVKQPGILLIPTAWVSKQFGKKHSLQFQLNPYSQYFVNNKAIVSNDIYTIKIQSGSQIDNKPNDIVYSETVSFNKLISIEASLLYNYQLTNKIKLGIGISNNWLQGALLQNKVVKNYTLVTRDSLYGINKHDKEWNLLESTFMLGKLEVQYQLKKFDIGISFSKPIGNVFSSNVQNKTPVNTNLFLKWRFK